MNLTDSHLNRPVILLIAKGSASESFDAANGPRAKTETFAQIASEGRGAFHACICFQ
jgi:hypothetical protein